MQWLTEIQAVYSISMMCQFEGTQNQGRCGSHVLGGAKGSIFPTNSIGKKIFFL
jgi:hypothetical protein